MSTFRFAQGFSIIETAWFEMEHQLRLLRPQLSTTNYGMLTLTCFFMHAWKPYACCDTSHVLCVDSAVTLYSLQMLFKKKGRYQRKNLLAVISQTSLKLLPSEGLSGKRVTFHVVAACNNRDHTTKSLYYCTSCSHRLLSRSRATHIRVLRTSRSWRIAHSKPHRPSALNKIKVDRWIQFMKSTTSKLKILPTRLKRTGMISLSISQTRNYNYL